MEIEQAFRAMSTDDFGCEQINQRAVNPPCNRLKPGRELPFRKLSAELLYLFTNGFLQFGGVGFDLKRPMPGISDLFQRRRIRRSFHCGSSVP